MATYQNASRARELIQDVARLNNAALANVNQLVDIRARLLALTQGQRDTIIQAVTDMGYDAAEIQAILGDWNTVKGTVDAQGITAVEQPR